MVSNAFYMLVLLLTVLSVFGLLHEHQRSDRMSIHLLIFGGLQVSVANMCMKQATR